MTAAAAHFSASYAEARGKFRDAAGRAGAVLASRVNPQKGPEGEELATDLAWLGPADASRLLITVSATHGAEGFCGSGIQIGSFEEGIGRELPKDTALLAVHAINPYGFAWVRRVTEDNVDLNRNYVDHAGELPENPGYEALAEAICPREWTDSVLAAAQAALEAYAEEHGAAALQQAVSGGQYRHADGIFYGGARPTWSRQVLEGILAEHAGRVRRLAIIDYHTGLGPYGYGEPIVLHAPGSAGLKRAEEWYGERITSPALGSSSSAQICGDNLSGTERLIGDRVEFTGMALEFGTVAMRDALEAMRGDNWLHLYGKIDSAQGRKLKRAIRDAFYCDKDDWKAALFEQGMQRQRQALAGLAG